jgi:hypothetical protein
MDPTQLARTWQVGLDAAKQTLQKTTQRGVRSVLHPNIERRFPTTGDRHLHYRGLTSSIYHDTLFSLIKSTRGNTCTQIYASDFGWSRIFHMKKESDVHATLDEVFHRYGVPKSLISDQAKSLTQGEFKRKARQAGCPCDVTDPYSPWMNSAEGEIREVKRLAGQWQMSKQSPKVL